jgi:hypothetical protein
MTRVAVKLNVSLPPKDMMRLLPTVTLKICLHEYMLCCVLSCMQYRACTFALLSARFCNMSISQSRKLHMETQISLQNRERREKKEDSCRHI